MTSAFRDDFHQLADLIERQAKEFADLWEPAAIWQIRDRRAEKRLLELTAGEVPTNIEPKEATIQEAVESPESDRDEPQGFWAKVRSYFDL